MSSPRHALTGEVIGLQMGAKWTEGTGLQGFAEESRARW